MLKGFETGKLTTDRKIKRIITLSQGQLIKYDRRGELGDHILNLYEKLVWDFEPTNDDDKFIWWGFLRNTKHLYETCKKRNIDFYFVDHPYFFHKKHGEGLGHGFIRIVKNAFNLTKINDTNEKKLEHYEKIDKSQFKLSNWKKGGSKIVIFPPSFHMTKFLDMDREQLINDTIEKLKQYTDRKIEVRLKKQNGEYNSMPLLQQLEDTHAVVSFQSNGAIKAIQHGIPSFVVTPEVSACTPVSETDLSKIETPYYPDNRREWQASLMNNQFVDSEYNNAIGYLDRYE